MEIGAVLAQANCFHSFRFTATDTVVFDWFSLRCHLVRATLACQMSHPSIAIEIGARSEPVHGLAVAAVEVLWRVLRRQGDRRKCL